MQLSGGVDVSSEENQLTGKRSMRQLMAGIFVAPIAAAANFQANYIIVPFACQSGWWPILNVTPVIALAVALYGVYIAHLNWRAGGSAWPDEEGGTMSRTRFLGMFGILFGSVACALILMQWIPIYLMSPCVGG
jgi:hypothetical protein